MNTFGDGLSSFAFLLTLSGLPSSGTEFLANGMGKEKLGVRALTCVCSCQCTQPLDPNEAVTDRSYRRPLPDTIQRMMVQMYN